MATVSAQKSSQSLLEQFNTTRERTLELVKTLERDDFVVQTAYYMSPPKMASWPCKLALRGSFE